MEIKGFIPSSLLEWEGRLACVLFLPSCNLRCRYCHAGDLLEPDRLETVPRSRVLAHLRSHRNWLDGAVITGGEPTLHGDELIDLIRDIRRAGLEVMVETNGTRPDMVERLVSERIVDAIAMDVKAPLSPEAYRQVTGRDVPVEDVRASIRCIISSGIAHELRVTLVPGLVGEAELKLIAPELGGAQLVALQNFKPDSCLDPALRSVTPYTPQEIDGLARVLTGHVGRVVIRGRDRRAAAAAAQA